MDSATENMIKEMLDVALKMFENSVMVRDLGVNGHVPNCNEGFSKKADGSAVCLKQWWFNRLDQTYSNVCFGSGTDGQGFDGRPYSREMTVCTKDNANCDKDSHQCDTCEVVPVGDSVVEGVHFYLYVTAFYANACQGATLAYAGACHHGRSIGELSYGRPDMGYTNICPDKVSTDMSDNEKAGFINTLFHEISHALAFSGTLFTFFVDGNGNPTVERETPSLGLMSPPAATRTMMCFDGENSMTDVFAAESVLCTGNKRGHPVHMICSPEVQRVTREITGCDTVEGAELNWLPSTVTPDTCYGSHWSAYVFNNAIMNAASLNTDETPDNYMKLTFALFADSGWYQVDYHFAQGNPWTDNKGCSFMDTPCIVNGVPTDDNWCVDTSVSGCDPNHFQAKFCNRRSNFPYSPMSCGSLDEINCLNNRGNYCNWVNGQCVWHIYPWLNHEVDGGLAFGSSVYMEYCPHRSTTHTGRACVQEDGQSCFEYEGCIFGKSSRCAVGTAIHNNYVPGNVGSGKCYDMECAPDGQSFTMTAIDRSGERQSVTCTQDGAQVQFGGTFTGWVTCPKIGIICPNNCPNACTGKGTCLDVNGTPTCVCFSGHVGDDCSGFDPQAWLATDWRALSGHSSGGGDSGGVDSGGGTVCCSAMIASCLACSAGTTVDAYCQTNPGTSGCPTVCCGAMTLECMACAAGMSKDQYCAANPTSDVCPTVCCQAMTADCMACSAGMMVDVYCAANPTTDGCPTVCCEAMTLECMACAANLSEDQYCEANPEADVCLTDSGCTENTIDSSIPCAPRVCFGGNWITAVVECPEQEGEECLVDWEPAMEGTCCSSCPCDDVACTQQVCWDDSSAPRPEGECCGDMSLCPPAECEGDEEDNTNPCSPRKCSNAMWMETTVDCAEQEGVECLVDWVPAPEGTCCSSCPCDLVRCTQEVCWNDSNAPRPEGECCGDLSLCPPQPTEEPCLMVDCLRGCDLVGTDDRGCGGDCICTTATEEPCLMVDCLRGCDLVGTDDRGCGGDCICTTVECEGDEEDNTNPCSPLHCSNGMWVEVAVDCAEWMGVECPVDWVPAPEGECCSSCPCDDVFCPEVACSDGSNPSVPVGECCGDLAACPNKYDPPLPAQMNSIKKLLDRGADATRFGKIGKRAGNILKQQKEGDRLHPDVKKAMRKIRRFSKQDFSQSKWNKMQNNYNDVAHHG